MLGQVLDERPDVLVLHQGPDAPVQRRRGSPEVRALLEAQDHPAVVLCGHCYWEEPPRGETGGGRAAPSGYGFCQNTPVQSTTCSSLEMLCLAR